MVMEGADVAQLRTVAFRMTESADKLETVGRSVHSLVNISALWRGADAHRFRSEWNGASARSLKSAADVLRRVSLELRRHADEQESASSFGPQGAADLFRRIENDLKDDQHNALETKKTGDGLRIEKVLGPDGDTRLIVYFKGQDSVDSRSLLRSGGLASGLIGADDEVVRKVTEALATLPKGQDSEVMLVGLSQGGMDAQNIAASGKFNVTDIVTFGSPVVRADDPGISTVHIRAEGDPVPVMGESVSLLPGPGSKNVFIYDAENDGFAFDVHANGYPGAASLFDHDSVNPKAAAAKASWKKFEGTVTVVAE